ncbi:hypothetical protein [Streptomyces sp. NPDC086010]|uniref:hypothetical protein n=1 Tax=Streptomyces sp. NPDC086010 TaxID=3365745 RepID=UPI0037D2A7D0
MTFEKGPRVGAEATLRSLGAHLDDSAAAEDGAYSFADVHRDAPDVATDGTSVYDAGTFVEFSWVRQVTADFRYRCGNDRPVTGRATSWMVDGSGVLECSEPLKDEEAGSPGLAAARLSCGPDAPAARTGRAGVPRS